MNDTANTPGSNEPRTMVTQVDQIQGNPFADARGNKDFESHVTPPRGRDVQRLSTLQEEFRNSDAMKELNETKSKVLGTVYGCISFGLGVIGCLLMFTPEILMAYPIGLATLVTGILGLCNAKKAANPKLARVFSILGIVLVPVLWLALPAGIMIDIMRG